MKIFNKLMYFFGYAPIKVSQEIKYYVLPQQMKYNRLDHESSISLTEIQNISPENLIWLKKRLIRDLKQDLFNKITSLENAINIEEINDGCNQKIIFRAKIYVGELEPYFRNR